MVLRNIGHFTREKNENEDKFQKTKDFKTLKTPFISSYTCAKSSHRPLLNCKNDKILFKRCIVSIPGNQQFLYCNATYNMVHPDYNSS